MITDLERVLLDNGELTENIDSLKEMAFRFQELMMMYESAIKGISTKLEILNNEFQIKSKRNPIRYIKHRIKKPDSILEKLHRRGFEVSIESIMENLHDIAGIRVICSYNTDIYAIANLLMKQDDVRIILLKDYIKNPKPNGYRSLHLVIEIPVYFSDRKQYIKVEVQIRTMAMDFWASLEHHLHYKTEGNVPPEIYTELKECADIIHSTDSRMQGIYDKVQNM